MTGTLDTPKTQGTGIALGTIEVSNPATPESPITYHQQVSYCGKARCRKCREGVGHGPYWYAYQNVNGRTVRTYIGKKLPQEVQATREEAPAGLDQARLRISVLGQFGMERRNGLDWKPVNDAAWQHQRVRSLLACLLSSPGRKLGREQVIDTLWPDLDLDVGIDRLNRAVHSLRQVFEPSRSRPATSTLLLTEREMLILADQSQIWVDADAFEYLLNQAHNSGDSENSERLLEQAEALYGGVFLPEAVELPWTAARREMLQRNWIGLLLELADLNIKTEKLNIAIETLNKLLRVDPENEAAVQRLIILLSQMDRRGEALQSYRSLANTLKNNYDIKPLSETSTLYNAVLQGEVLSLESAQGLSVTNQEAKSSSNRPQFELQIGRRHQSKLIGRDQELEAIRQLLQATRLGKRYKLSGQKKGPGIALQTHHKPQCVLLMGDAGIGKTRMAEEMSREAKKQGWAIAWSRVYAQESHIPYRLWIEAMRKAMDYSTWHKEEIKKHPLVYHTLSALLPELHEQLPKIDFAPQVSAEQEQLRLREAALELLTIISDKTPLLVVLDDLHWADSSSCELLAYLARHQTGRQIIVVATCRDTELPTSHPLRTLIADLQREQAVTTINIQPLTDEQIGKLVEHLPHKLIDHIKQRAAGNPFFAEELARITTAPGTGGAVLPETIAAVLELRLGRLSEPCQKLLAKASVIDGNFQFELLRLMDAGTGGSDNEDDLLDLLEEAQQAGVLAEEGAGTNVNYHFWHPLVANHLYENLSAARRARLHRQAASALKQIYEENEEEGAGIITEHLVKGGADSGQVTYYSMLAGDHALALSAYAEAEGYYRQAIEHLEADSKQKRPEKKKHDLGYLLEQLAECRRVQGDFAEARLLYQRVLNLHTQRHGTPSKAEMAGDEAYNASNYPEAEQHYRLAVAQLEATIQNEGGENNEELQLHLADLLEQLGECRRIQGDFEEARHLYQRVLTIHNHQQNFASYTDYQEKAQVQALLWRAIGLTWYDNGDNIQARYCCKQGEQILRKAGITSGPAWANLHLQQGFISWTEGDFDNARKASYRALEMFEEAQQQKEITDRPAARVTLTRRTLQGDPLDVGRAHTLLGTIIGTSISNSASQIDALSHFNTALAIFEQHNNQREISRACVNLGNIYLMRAEHDLAQAALRRSLSIAEKTGDLPFASTNYCNIGLLTARSGDLVEARDWFDKSLSIAKQINDQVYISLISSLQSLILQDRGELDEAKISVYQGLSISHSTHITPFIGQALVALGNLRISQSLVASLHIDHKQKSMKVTLLPLNTRIKESIDKKLLLRAKRTLNHALILEEIETETRLEGQLALAHVSLRLKDKETALQQVIQALEEASSNTLTWIEIRCQKLLGDILAAQGKIEQAKEQFQMVEERLREQSPGIEYGRTLLSHGKLLAQQGRENKNKASYQQGLAYLKQAQQIFEKCHAVIDQQMALRAIEEYKV